MVKDLIEREIAAGLLTLIFLSKSLSISQTKNQSPKVIFLFTKDFQKRGNNQLINLKCPKDLNDR